MGIIKGFVKTIEIPGEEHRVTFRMLSHFELEDARDARFEKMRGRMKAIREIRGELPARIAPAEVQAATAADPLVEFDTLRLLQLAVTSWTYKDAEGNPLPLDVTIFDEDTAPFVAREIAKYSSPSLAELGKASASSTAT